METMSMLLVVIGFGLLLIGGLWVVVNAFKESILWGLGALFVPFVSLFFIIKHWDENKLPFFVQLGGLVIYVAGAMMIQPDMAVAAAS
jgi:hypothetical protein